MLPVQLDSNLRTLTDSDVEAIAKRIVGLVELPKPARRRREPRIPFSYVEKQSLDLKMNRARIAANQSSVTPENVDLQDLPMPMLQALLKRPYGLLR